MPLNKPGYYERSKRRAAAATTGQTGPVATVKRGFAMIGALAREAVSPTENLPSRAELQKEHQGKMKKSKAAAMKRSEPTRKQAEAATGVSSVANPLRAVQALTERAAANKKKRGM